MADSIERCRTCSLNRNNMEGWCTVFKRMPFTNSPLRLKRCFYKEEENVSWEMQIWVMNHIKNQKEWVSVKSSDYNERKGYTYRYPNEIQAMKALESSYPNCAREARVLKVNYPSNMKHANR